MVFRDFVKQGGVCLGMALFASTGLLGQTLESFVAVTPCRVVDTRNATGPLGGPIMAALSSRSFPIPQSTCGLPYNATAYSLNVTVVPPGGLGFLTIWPTGSTQPVVSTLNDFQATIVANAAIVPAGTSGAITVYVTDATHVVIDVNGYFVANSNASNSNTSIGQGALPVAAGGQNTGVGASALANNTTGTYNTATGSTAMLSNSTGSYNTAYGQGALLSNSTGQNNTGLGYQALASESTAGNNVALGYQAMYSSTASNSVAVGSGTLGASTGNNNIAIGDSAGSNLVSGANNIDIGNTGASGDVGLIKIGTAGNQTAAYVAGITGVNVAGGAAVVVSSSGQLGVVASSRRYKQDIQPMADVSDRLMQLEPVTFRYKQASADGSQPLQFGLIAEQVAAVYPELAVYGKDGQVETLQYQQLPALLLNEIQKQHKTIEDLNSRIAALEQLLKANAPAAAAR